MKISKGIMAIEDKAFWNNNNLISVEIPDSVVNIGRNATNRKNMLDEDNKNLRIYCHKE